MWIVKLNSYIRKERKIIVLLIFYFDKTSNQMFQVKEENELVYIRVI